MTATPGGTGDPGFLGRLMHRVQEWGRRNPFRFLMAAGLALLAIVVLTFVCSGGTH